MKKSAIIFITIFCFCLGTSQTLPDGFFLDVVSEGYEYPGGVTFIDSSSWYVWDISGEVSLVVNGIKQEAPVIDIKEEVGYWHDHGLLSAAIHPDFLINGYLYLYYTVDRHHLLYHGTPQYHPDSNLYYDATIARLTRYEINLDGFNQIIPDSREVLIGDEIFNGVPILSFSHAGGSILFGEDNTLLLTTGDGNSGAYNGEGEIPDYAYDLIGMQDSIINEKNNVGGFRSQLLESLNGKVIRIDPISGDGIASNPFYDSNKPQSVKSKIWALGLRNPFRASLKPLTGTTNPLSGDPGHIFIGDVGYWRWEELNISAEGGENFGWPLFEGIDNFYEFNNNQRPNFYTTNPLFDGEACGQENYLFGELLQQPTLDHSNFFENPCAPQISIQDEAQTFLHSMPTITWVNAINEGEPYNTLLPGFNSDGIGTGMPIEELPGIGSSFIGSASIGGDFYFGNNYPEEYFGAYFHIDFAGWIKVFWLDQNNRLDRVEPFTENLWGIVHAAYNPFDENLYFTDIINGRILRLSYGGNRPPLIQLDTNVFYGASPLAVSFDASGSFDPDEDPISFYWDFGDGQSSDQPIVTHVYESPDSNPYLLEAELQITDTAGNMSSEDILISLNNTPPEVEISSISDNQLYDGFNPSELELIAEVFDFEHDQNELSYEWQTFLHHNTHYHSEPVDTNTSSSAVISPLGCDNTGEYFYRFSLRVTDDHGLSGYNEKSIYPDCFPKDDANLSFTLFPNPNDGSFILLSSSYFEGLVKINVYDASGKVVYSTSDLSFDHYKAQNLGLGLSSGIYLLQIQAGIHSKTIRMLISKD